MQANNAFRANSSIQFGQKINSGKTTAVNAKPAQDKSVLATRPDTFERSHKTGSSPQFKGYNALHAAASKGDVQKIHHLVTTKDFDYLNEQDEQGNTPLLIAARDNQMNAVRILMGSKGVDTRARNFNQEDVYEIAFKRGHWKMVEFLEKKMGITCLPKIMRTGGFFFKNG